MSTTTSESELPPREPEDTLDQILCQELRWEVPPMLSAQLLALVPGAPVVSVPRMARPKSWYSMFVLLLTAVAIGLSLAVAWQLYSAIGVELGLGAMLTQLQAAPALGLQRLYDALPASRQVVSLLVAVRDQLHWLLLAVVLWLALDGWQPRRSSQRTTS
ncbi:anti-sigma factor [Oscillochloris sp. ZM17-4]|uniref:anti-sigma factor n=1 Tax=Oscillochloris sp. ZM17-4 TaxID=2866714 RepID=UPI001C736416|nr:anti-sigma factor [Oscillochloris sp. ZM17-4]MBX0327432.1 anti-sigma factor [Oscillochloris sp. ZM17-4]